MKKSFLRTSMLTLSLAITALGCNGSMSMPEDEAITESAQAIEVGELIVYEAGHPVPQDELSPLDPAAFGAQILEGDATWSGRIDILEGTLIGGVFQAMQGKYSITYPGVVHGSIIVGEVLATTGGQTYHLHRGDSFLVTKGTYVEFETLGDKHQASFLGNFASPDMPGHFYVHEQGSVASSSELVSLGSPADFNATVLEGDPSFEGRLDYASSSEMGGFFRATRSKMLIDPMAVTEHGTVTRHGLTMTGADGVSRMLNPGDAYLVKAGGQFRLEVDGPEVQESFFAVAAP